MSHLSDGVVGPRRSDSVVLSAAVLEIIELSRLPTQLKVLEALN